MPVLPVANPVDTTPVALRAAPAAGRRNVLIELHATNDHTTDAATLIVLDGTTEVARFRLLGNGASPLHLRGTPQSPAFPRSTFTAATAIQVKLAAAGSVRVVAKISDTRA